jgi:hypothetical protein
MNQKILSFIHSEKLYCLFIHILLCSLTHFYNEKKEKIGITKRENKLIFYISSGFSKAVLGPLALGGGHSLSTSQCRVL